MKWITKHSCRFDSNKFHEFWCSHLSCRICNFSQNKSISNDKLECTIAKGSSGWSKRIYYLLYLEFKIKRYQSATTHTLEGSRGHEKTPDRSGPQLDYMWDWLAPPLCRLALGYAASPWASRMFLLCLLGSHLHPIEVGLSNGGRGRSHGSMTWQLLCLYSTSAYIRMPPTPSRRPSLI
jgi:hypothetical protein